MEIEGCRLDENLISEPAAGLVFKQVGLNSALVELIFSELDRLGQVI